MLKLDRKTWLWFYAIGLALLGLSIFQAFRLNQGGRIQFLDVGQGDAILIQTPEFHQILIDAGPGSAVVDELGRTMDFFDKSIDLFVLTHPDRDHFGGILDAIQKYTIGRILMVGIASDDAFYREFEDQIRGLGIPVDFAESDRDYQIGPDLYLDVLYPVPGRSLVGQKLEDKNNSSAVVRLVQMTENGIRPIALITGDAERPEEYEILRSGEEVDAEILKLGHHGSKSSTSEAWLVAVSPKIAVVSAGADNRYGHPAPETMEKVKNLEVRRTDREGTITIKF
jgi:competence protein ComEC